MNNTNPSAEYIQRICNLYDDVYDDRREDSQPGGEDWIPGTKANHRSLSTFKRQLEEEYDISLSTGKIRKILITGGCWTTERSRSVYEMYVKYSGDVKKVADELGVSTSLVSMYLPYGKTVYSLDQKSKNAIRIDRWRSK